MGEYAIRKSDNQEVKIGTLESMYYLRFEDRDKVRFKPGNVNMANPEQVSGSRFRLPFPDEDDILPGDYKDHNRGLRLYKLPVCDWCGGTGKNERFGDRCPRCYGNGTLSGENYSPADLINHPGRMHFRHDEAGLQISLPCFHGMKLPLEGVEDVTTGWNGKGYAFELAALKAIWDGNHFNVIPVIRCRFCDEMWRSEWADIADYLPSDWRFLLERYATEAQAA